MIFALSWDGIAPSATGPKKQLSVLSPLGQTPIAYALNQAADDFSTLQGERALVLVTDGIESCGGDPVQAARDLREQGIKVHLIGFGMASANLQGGGTVCALAAVNAAGSPLIGDTRHFWAAPFEEQDEFGGLGLPHPWPEDAKVARTKAGQRVAGANTTLAMILTDVALSSSQAKRIAISAHDGIALAVYPAHSPLDGDTIFTLTTFRRSRRTTRSGSPRR